MTTARRLDLTPLRKDPEEQVTAGVEVPSPARIGRREQGLKSRIGFTGTAALLGCVALTLWLTVPTLSRPLSTASGPSSRAGSERTSSRPAPSATPLAATRVANERTSAATLAVATPAVRAPILISPPAAGASTTGNGSATGVSGQTAPPAASTQATVEPTSQPTRAATVEPTTQASSQATSQPAVPTRAPATVQPTAGATARGSGSAAPAAAQSARVHTVEKGDTLFSLARRYGTTVDAIVAANGLGSSGATLRIGLTLTMP